MAAVAFLLVPAVAFVLGVRPAAFENRALAAFPAVTEGWGFLGGLPPWASDHLPLRQQAVQAADGISRGVFGEPFPFGARTGSGIVGPVAAAAGDATPAAPDGVSVPRADSEGLDPLYPPVIPGLGGWDYLGDDVVRGCRPTLSPDAVIVQLLQLKAAVEASGRTFVLVVPPNKSSVVTENLPASFLGSDCLSATRDAFWARAAAVAAVDLRRPLADMARVLGPEAVYFPEDSHWTFRGGLLLTQVLAQLIDPAATASWRTSSGPAYTGSADLPPLVGRTGVDETPTIGLSPDGGHDRTRYDLSADARTVRLSSQPGTGTIDVPVSIIGDSYSQWATPFLAATFTDATVVRINSPGQTTAQFASAVASGHVVAVALVERIVTTGYGPLFDPSTMAAVLSALAAAPR